MEWRTWYGHVPKRFAEFSWRYQTGLEDPERAAALQRLRALAQKRPLTLITASKAIEITKRRCWRSSFGDRDACLRTAHRDDRM
jgi:uncharacterized protein YeaO (DUF488 family)